MATIEQDVAAIRTAVYGEDVREAIADGLEQVALTFDSVPTSGSSNPVTSGGLYTSLKAPFDNLNSSFLNTSRVVSSVQKTVTANGFGVFSVPIFNMANGYIRVNVSGAKLKRGGQYEVFYSSADGDSSHTVHEEGTVQLQGMLTLVPTLAIDCSNVTIRVPFSESGTATCTVTYTPGSGPRNSLVLKDGNGEVTLTAAQLRSLLAMLNS